MTQLRFVGINFDHMHMGDNLRMVVESPMAQLVGICDLQPERMEESITRLNIPRDQVFTSPEQCLENAKADVAILCPASAEHGVWVERVAPYVKAILMEKPFAASLAEADRMMAACQKHNTLLHTRPPKPLSNKDKSVRLKKSIITTEIVARCGIRPRKSNVQQNGSPQKSHTAGFIQLKEVAAHSWIISDTAPLWAPGISMD
jgi:hypothetical protein